MSTFEKNNFFWQMRQGNQRFGEWLEVLFSGDGSQAPPSNTTADPALPIISPRVVEVIFWLILIALVALLIWILFPKVRNWVGSFRPTFAPTGVPSQIRHSRSEWWQIAQTARQQGNYSGAINALYMAALESLNDRKLILQDRSRTDGEYLRAVKQLQRSRPYQTLIETHERMTFAKMPVNQETYQECEQAYQAIDQDNND